jgi:hypothetical protein
VVTDVGAYLHGASVFGVEDLVGNAPEWVVLVGGVDLNEPELVFDDNTGSLMFAATPRSHRSPALHVRLPWPLATTDPGHPGLFSSLYQLACSCRYGHGRLKGGRAITTQFEASAATRRE